jgi:hypothetical protein
MTAQEECRSGIVPKFLKVFVATNFMGNAGDNTQEPKDNTSPHAQVVYGEGARQN